MEKNSKNPDVKCQMSTNLLCSPFANAGWARSSVRDIWRAHKSANHWTIARSVDSRSPVLRAACIRVANFEKNNWAELSWAVEKFCWADRAELGKKFSELSWAGSSSKKAELSLAEWLSEKAELSCQLSSANLQLWLVSFAAGSAALASDSDSFCAAQSAVLRRRQFWTRAALAIRLLTRPAAFRLTFAHRWSSHIVASITVKVTAHAHDRLFLCTVLHSICGRQQLGAQDFDSTNILHTVQKMAKNFCEPLIFFCSFWKNFQSLENLRYF